MSSMRKHIASSLSLLAGAFSLLGVIAVVPMVGVVLGVSLAASPASAQPYYLRSTVGLPWGRSDNEQAMDAVFGSGNWVDARYETVNAASMFATSEFIFMEGSDRLANEMEAFISANAAAISTFVNGGGVIFFNAAPNEGNGMSVGFGVSITYPSSSCGSGCTAVDPAHPIFNGPFSPVGTTFSGSSFSHATISGPVSPILRDPSGNTLLGELSVGGGVILVGGMTHPTFHSPGTEAINLRRNIIAYGMDAAPDCFVLDAIDDSFTVINDGTIATLAVLDNDECRGDAPVSVIREPGDLQPDRGGAAITNGTEVLYTPSLGFVGFEEFSYTARDAGIEGGENPPSVDQDRAQVIVSVHEDVQPDAVDDVVTTLQNQTLNIDVLTNDNLGNGPGFALEIESNPSSGTVTLNADDTIRYSPNFGFFGEDSFEYRLTDENGDIDVGLVTVGVFFVRGAVPIDIMPNDAGNNINLRAGPGAGFNIAILSAGEFFDAPSLIDPLTLKFGPRQANIWGTPSIRDVDRDGDDDLVVKFLIQQTGIACGDTSATLSGRTFEFQSISGSDSINTFNCPRIRKRH